MLSSHSQHLQAQSLLITTDSAKSLHRHLEMTACAAPRASSGREDTQRDTQNNQNVDNILSKKFKPRMAWIHNSLNGCGNPTVLSTKWLLAQLIHQELHICHDLGDYMVLGEMQWKEIALSLSLAKPSFCNDYNDVKDKKSSL